MLSEALSFYDDLWSRRDKRVDGWLLMSGPMPTVALCLSYVYIVKVWGPNFMRDRKPYNVRNFLIVYNAFQVVFSSWMFWQILTYGWANGYSVICQPVDYSDNPEAIWMAHMVWWYYFSKLIDFVDSFAFVAQKKFTHVSFLHVFHHGFMPFNVWWYARWLGGGHYTFMGLLNTFVHVWMYFYYMIAAMGPQYSKYIWWKRHITNMQLVQFVVVFIHDTQVIFQKDCDVPWQPAAYISIFAVIFFALFSHFYIQAYLKKNKEKKEDKTHNDRNGNFSKSEETPRLKQRKLGEL